MKVCSLFLFSIILIGCGSVEEKASIKPEYGYDLGDILFDSTQDSPDFKLCDSTKIIHRRNALSYPGGKTEINRLLLNDFVFDPAFASFNGYVVLRFLINCDYEKGRFRVQTLDTDFSLKSCPPQLVEHLIDITKTLDNWNHRLEEDKPLDCSKYLNFKITNGNIESILH